MKNINFFIILTTLAVPSITLCPPKKTVKKQQSSDDDRFLKEYNAQNQQAHIKLAEQKKREQEQKNKAAQQKALQETHFIQEFPDYKELGIATKLDRESYKQALSKNIDFINLISCFLYRAYTFAEANFAEAYYSNMVEKYPFIELINNNNQSGFEIKKWPENFELAAYFEAFDANKTKKRTVSHELIALCKKYIIENMHNFSAVDKELAQCKLEIFDYIKAHNLSITYSKPTLITYKNILNNIEKAQTLSKELKDFGQKAINAVNATFNKINPSSLLTQTCTDKEASLSSLEQIIVLCKQHANFLQKLDKTAQKLNIIGLKKFQITSNFAINNVENINITFEPTIAQNSSVHTNTLTTDLTTTTTTPAQTEIFTNNSKPCLTLSANLPYKHIHSRIMPWLTENPDKVFESVKHTYLKLNPKLATKTWFKQECIFGHTFSQTCDIFILQHCPAHKTESFQKQGAKQRPAYWAFIVPAYVIFDDGYQARIYLTYYIDHTGTIFHRCAQKRSNNCNSEITDSVEQRLKDMQQEIEDSFTTETMQVTITSANTTAGLSVNDTAEINELIIKIRDSKNKATIIIPRMYTEDEVTSTDFYKKYNT